MLVSELMSTRVVTVKLDDTLDDVRELFERTRFHHLVVLDRGQVVGVVSDRDVLRHRSPFADTLAARPIDEQSREKPVHQIMSRGVVTTVPDATTEDAARSMLERRISCLPVVDNGRLVGIVTSRDLLRVVAGLDWSPSEQPSPTDSRPPTRR